MKIFDKITNFVYCVTHVNQLLAEIDNLTAEKIRLDTENNCERRLHQQVYNSYKTLEAERDALLKQFKGIEENFERMCNEASRLSDENHQLRSDALMYHNAVKALCEQGIDADRAKSVYEAVAHYVDKDGSELFGAAQQILGTFDCSHFAYEDNRGYFEEEDGNKLLRYLLVQYDHKLGDANADKDRWEIACSGYEKCVDLSIDETTPEYQEFEKQLYIKVLENLKLLTPAETQAKEVAA